VRLTDDPLFLVSPDDANGDGFAHYPAGTHTRIAWGAGFQAGVYYADPSGWAGGVSLKSPQWLEGFRYQSADELGRPRSLSVHFDYPLMASLGIAYSGLEQWLFAADLRYIDYRNTPGFDHTGFDRTAAVRGLGWQSVFALALGGQFQATNWLSLRAGYSFNTDPIDDSRTMFNVASPLILQHTLYVGASVCLSDALLLSVSYAHAFQNAGRGAFLTPFGPVPGSVVENQVSADGLGLGITVRF
jgi:long-chain fatty acid transport protein